jgi:hypothetical protein
MDQLNGVIGVIPFLPIAILIAILVVHIAFAMGVSKACHNRTLSGRTTNLVAPWLWILATLLGGPVMGCMYWIVNESGLNKEAYLKREQ